MDLSGKRIWITGAGSGIGRALALELSARGAILMLTSRNEARLKELSAQIGSSGARALVLPGDVRSPDSMKAAVQEGIKALGVIDILIANAGTHIQSYPEKFNAAEYLEIMQTNFAGMLHAMQAVIPGMIAAGSGTIAGMCSLAGYRGLPLAAAYGASKAAMIHFLESSRFHLKPRGIRVVVINPGFVKTPLTDRNTFHMPYLTATDVAARKIREGLEKEKIKITFPRPFTWLLEAARILPDFIYQPAVERLWQRMERR